MMKSATKDKVYKSPVRKLAWIFEKSRDQWKAKCREAKKMVKYLKNRVRFLEESRDRWKNRAQELEAQMKKMESAARKLNEKQETSEPKDPKVELSVGDIDDFTLVPHYHQYSVGHVKLFIDLVLSDATSFRGASRATQRMMSALQIPMDVPEWHTGRLWLLRLGYYELTRPKEKADDWIWIADHTVQIGTEKCFIVLGLRLKDLPPVGQCLRHQDVELIALLPVEKSTKEVVYRQLEENVEKTGVPRAIVGDHGSDLKAGVEKFCQEHPETTFIYDIKHKTATVLKHEFARDETWLEFTRLAARTKRQVQQTSLAHLAPPNQRTKARYMNVDVLVNWGLEVLDFLNRQQGKETTKCNSEQVQEKLGWVARFREPLKEWGEMLQLTTTTESFVRRRGLYGNAHLELAERLQDIAHTDRAREMRTELINFVAQESAQAHSGERLLGSSEVIESVLGKLKYLERDQARSGFTGLLLSIGAIVSSATSEVILTALESVPTKKVLTWCKETLGRSVQAKRQKAFTSRSKMEQKWDQSWAAV